MIESGWILQASLSHHLSSPCKIVIHPECLMHTSNKFKSGILKILLSFAVGFSNMYRIYWQILNSNAEDFSMFCIMYVLVNTYRTTGTCKAHSTIPLLLKSKFQASIHLLCLYSPVCVGPGWKPRRQVFS